VPIFGGLVATVFGWFIAHLGAQIGARVALAAAVLAVVTASYVAVRLAVVALLATVGAVSTPAVVSVLAMCLPTNLAACLTVLFLSDAILEAYAMWRGSFAVASGFLRV